MHPELPLHFLAKNASRSQGTILPTLGSEVYTALVDSLVRLLSNISHAIDQAV
jgi:hypothetical protein